MTKLMSSIEDPNAAVKRRTLNLRYNFPVDFDILKTHFATTDSIRSKEINHISLIGDRIVKVLAGKQFNIRLKTFFIPNNPCIAISDNAPIVVSTPQIKKKNTDEENIKISLSKFKWRPWQKALFDEISDGPRKDGRSIRWYYDHQGGVGKSTFGEHVGRLILAGKVVVVEKEMSENLAVILEETRKTHPPVAIIINLTGSKSHTITRSDELYDNIEMMSDTFRDTWIIVFSNTFPTLDYMPMNRWVLRRAPITRLAERSLPVEVDCTKLQSQKATIKKVFRTILHSDDRSTGEYKKLMTRPDIVDSFLNVKK